MTNSKATRRALVSSVIALALCFAMLLGTTFAWFTDTASSNGNTITTGDLKIELYKWNGTTENDRVKVDGTSLYTADTKWEPNATNVVYLSVRNEGTLTLKYRVVLDVTDVTSTGNYDLTDVLYYDFIENAKYGEVTEWSDDEAVKVEEGKNATQAVDVTLAPGAEHFFALSVHMDEEAGNMYQDLSIKFDIDVIAGQQVGELDSFGTTYDKFAGYPGTGFAPAMADGQTGVEIIVTKQEGENTTTKVGSVLIPAAAADPNATGFEVNIEESDYEPNFSIAQGSTITPYEVTVTGLKENNDVPVKVELRIPAGLDPATVKLYHYDDEIACNYNPNTGYVSFETATFSPFTVVYKADSEYVPAPALPENIPTATVTYYPDWVGNEDIVWGGFGDFTPAEGVEAVIDASFVFECPEEVDEAYKYWLCDFYVSLDRALGANEIFLAGQYGTYLVGFHNKDFTLPADEEIPLLGTAIGGNTEGVTNWTYADVESFVETFTCGVGDVDGCLEGATFTVCLRLINPDDHTEYYDVNVVTYTFGAGYNIQ